MSVVKEDEADDDTGITIKASSSNGGEDGNGGEDAKANGGTPRKVSFDTAEDDGIEMGKVES